MSRRAGLSPEAVTAAAAALVDAEGPEALTLARLAAELGVRAPSLYAHVGGLDDLRRRAAVLGVRRIADALRDAAAGRARGDALAAVARAYRDHAHAHPGTYALAQRAPARGDEEHQEAAAAVVGVLRAVLAGYGLEGADAVHAARAVRAALHGFVALELGGGFGLAEDRDESFDRLVALVDRGLAG